MRQVCSAPFESSSSPLHSALHLEAPLPSFPLQCGIHTPLPPTIDQPPSFFTGLRMHACDTSLEVMLTTPVAAAPQAKFPAPAKRSRQQRGR